MASQWFTTDGGAGSAWALTDVETPDSAAVAPASVSADPTGGTTFNINWVPGSGGGVPQAFEVEIEVPAGSSNWIAAPGATNPNGAGITSFGVTGRSPATAYTPRVRALRSGFSPSAWTTGTPVTTDNSVTGTVIIGASDATAPTLTGSITITGLTSTGYTATCPPGSDAVGVTGYQWRLGGTGTWTDIAAGGRTAPPFTGRTPASTDLIEMRCRDAAGNFSAPLSTNVTLLGIAPAVITQPISQSVVDGGSFTFVAAFSGTPAPTRQWHRNGAIIAGATGLSYTATASLADTGSVYTCTATNSAGAVTTNAATLTVTAGVLAPSITTQPASQTALVGQSVTFSVAATGTNPLAFQWLRNGIVIPGATASSHTITADASDNGVSFSVRISNAAGTVDSVGAALAVTSSLPVTWLDWSSELTMYLPDCPLSNIMLELKRQAVEFFRITRSHRMGPAQIALTTAWADEYLVALPAGWVLCGVPDSKVGEEEATEIEYEARTLDEDSCGHDLLVGMATETSLRVWPAPRTTGLPIRATLALTLADNATGLEAHLYRRHREHINAMVLERLMSQREKPWSNPQEARRYAQDAQAGRLLIATRAGPRSARMRLRTKPA